MPVARRRDPWPFAGSLERHLDLHPDRFDVRVVLKAEQEMPMVLGPHAWFPRWLVWPEALELTITNRSEHWVVFDALPDVVWVEPQTGRPDVVALGVATRDVVDSPGA